MSKFWKIFLNVWMHRKNILVYRNVCVYDYCLLLFLNFTCATILDLMTACGIMKSEMVAHRIMRSLPRRRVHVHLLKALIRCCFAVHWGTACFEPCFPMQNQWKLTHVQCTQYSEPFTCGTNIYLKSAGFLQLKRLLFWAQRVQVLLQCSTLNCD